MCVPQKYEGHSAGGLARRGKSEQSIAGGPKSLGAVAATPHTMPSICLFLGSADVPKREVPYSIDFACFIKCLDKVAVVLVNSPMLARRLDHPPRRKSFPYILLQPLCALFSSAALSFQSLAASFRKTPGVGVLHKSVLCYQQLPDSSSREVQTGGTAISGCRSQVFKGMSRRSTPRRPSLCGLP